MYHGFSSPEWRALLQEYKFTLHTRKVGNIWESIGPLIFRSPLFPNHEYEEYKFSTGGILLTLRSGGEVMGAIESDNPDVMSSILNKLLVSQVLDS